jgi:hypothetical protein
MTAKVVNFKKPDSLPARWRKHAAALEKTGADIDALKRRLELEYKEFLDVMKEDMGGTTNNPDITPHEQKAMGWASYHLDKCVKDALTLLECASERVGYATPHDASFTDWDKKH